MIIDTLNKQIVEAMKAKNEIRLSTLKLLSNEIHNFQIDHPNMTKEEELGVVKKEAKRRKDAIEAYKKANALERAEHEEEELKVLQEFLPAEMSDKELEKIVDEVLMGLPRRSLAEAGKVIGLVMKKTRGQADGKRVSELIIKKLKID